MIRGKRSVGIGVSRYSNSMASTPNAGPVGVVEGLQAYSILLHISMKLLKIDIKLDQNQAKEQRQGQLDHVAASVAAPITRHLASSREGGQYVAEVNWRYSMWCRGKVCCFY